MCWLWKKKLKAQKKEHEAVKGSKDIHLSQKSKKKFKKGQNLWPIQSFALCLYTKHLTVIFDHCTLYGSSVLGAIFDFQEKKKLDTHPNHTLTCRMC